MSVAATPCFNSVATAASRSRSTMKSLNRDATIPKRSPRALKSPSIALTRSSMRIFRLGAVHVLDDLEPETGKRVHVLRRADHAHATYTEGTHDLCADPERAEVHAAAAARSGRRLGPTER